MKVKLSCPHCGHEWTWCYLHWLFVAPFHWIKRKKKDTWRDYRKTECPNCGKKSWIARKK